MLADPCTKIISLGISDLMVNIEGTLTSKLPGLSILGALNREGSVPKKEQFICPNSSNVTIRPLRSLGKENIENGS